MSPPPCVIRVVPALAAVYLDHLVRFTEPYATATTRPRQTRYVATPRCRQSTNHKAVTCTFLAQSATNASCRAAPRQPPRIMQRDRRDTRHDKAKTAQPCGLQGGARQRDKARHRQFVAFHSATYKGGSLERPPCVAMAVSVVVVDIKNPSLKGRGMVGLGIIHPVECMAQDIHSRPRPYADRQGSSAHAGTLAEHWPAWCPASHHRRRLGPHRR